MNTKEIAAEARLALKKELPGWKFSVTFDSFSGGSSIDMCLMSGPEEVLDGGDGHAQINQYMLRDGLLRNNGCTLTPKGYEVLSKAHEILSRRHWDKSDAMTDYFCTNFYLHISVGKWNKGYEVKVCG